MQEVAETGDDAMSTIPVDPKICGEFLSLEI